MWNKYLNYLMQGRVFRILFFRIEFIMSRAKPKLSTTEELITGFPYPVFAFKDFSCSLVTGSNESDWNFTFRLNYVHSWVVQLNIRLYTWIVDRTVKYTTVHLDSRPYS